MFQTKDINLIVKKSVHANYFREAKYQQLRAYNTVKDRVSILLIFNILSQIVKFSLSRTLWN